VLGVKDAFARPVRAWFTISSLVLTIVLATMVLAAVGTIRAYIADPGRVGQLPNDLLLRRGPVAHAETARILSQHPEIAAVVAYTPIEAQPAAQSGVPIATRAVDGAGDLYGLVLLEGRMFWAPGEAIVPQGLLDRLGLHVGDEVRLQAKGRPLTLHIVGRYFSNENFGLVAMYSLATARQQIDPSLDPTEYAITLARGADRLAVQSALLRDSEDRFGILRWEPGEETGPLQSSLGALGAALLLISLINLLNTALLGVQERIRDTGILKAVGMTPGQIVGCVVVSVAVQALTAVLIGAPLGMLLSIVIYAWVTGRGGGGLDVPVPVDWAGIIALVLVAALVVAVLSSALPARRAAGLEVVDALRHE
jgi:putative ABC transport system permease protein